MGNRGVIRAAAAQNRCVFSDARGALTGIAGKTASEFRAAP